MNFIDIASWQGGIDLAKVFEENPLDGVIVKATEATAYVNPYYKQWTDWLLENGKPFGVYHFCAGGDAIAEATHFYNTVRDNIGKCVPCADYENPATNKGTAWLKKFLDRFYELSGVKCLIYCSQSITQSQNFDAIAREGYRLWMAQYADYQNVYGFKENPWHHGSVSPFLGYAMHQYTSCGYLDGYSGRLDFDLFYGNEQDWKDLCGDQEAPTVLKDPDPAVVADVLDGKYGINPGRITKLREAGYNPDKVQAKINELYSVADKVRPIVKSNLDYINSLVKIIEN